MNFMVLIRFLGSGVVIQETGTKSPRPKWAERARISEPEVRQMVGLPLIFSAMSE
jgi:hypothetical protein